MLKVRCPSCGKSAVLPESDAGLAAVCRACGGRYTVTEPAPPVEIGSISGEAGTSRSEIAGTGRHRARVAAAAVVLGAAMVAVLVVARVWPDPIDAPAVALYKSQAEAAAVSGQFVDAPHTGSFVQQVSYYRPDLVPLGSRP